MDFIYGLPRECIQRARRSIANKPSGLKTALSLAWLRCRMFARTPRANRMARVLDYEIRITDGPNFYTSYKDIFAQFLESVKTYSRSYGLGCAQTVTQVPFDELILRMMRMTGSVG